MTPRVRSAIVLLATFVLGIVLGALGLGALAHHRHGRMHDLHHETGFVRYVMEAIEPTDEAQRRAILPHVEATARAARAELTTTHARLMENLAAMRDSLRPSLGPEQMERLEASLEMVGSHAGRPPGDRNHPGHRRDGGR